MSPKPLVHGIDPVVLFEPTEGDRGKPSEELHLVADGTKSMFWSSLTDDYVSNSIQYQELVDEAKSLGLAVLLRSAEPELQSPFGDRLDVFILRPDQVWRVESLMAILRTARVYGYSARLIYLQSVLLGYSPEASSHFVEEKQHRRASWEGQTVYILLPQSSVDQLTPLGRRCFPIEMDTSAMLAFTVGSDLLSPRKNAHQLIPKTHRLCRFGLAHDFYKEVFGSELRKSVLVMKLDLSPERLNAALCSSIQVWTTTGWE